MIVRSPEIRQRHDFGMLADVRGCNIAVEIGVDQGHNAKVFLQRWHGLLLYAVDTWEPYVEMPWDRIPSPPPR